MAKRKLFDDLMQGLQEIRDHKAGKITLRTHEIEPPQPEIHAGELKRARDRLNMSQGVFAATFGLNKRTLERWEQGKGEPNASAAILIKMAEEYPDTIDRIRAVAEPPRKRSAVRDGGSKRAASKKAAKKRASSKRKRKVG